MTFLKLLLSCTNWSVPTNKPLTGKSCVTDTTTATSWQKKEHSAMSHIRWISICSFRVFYQCLSAWRLCGITDNLMSSLHGVWLTRRRHVWGVLLAMMTVVWLRLLCLQKRTPKTHWEVSGCFDSCNFPHKLVSFAWHFYKTFFAKPAMIFSGNKGLVKDLAPEEQRNLPDTWTNQLSGHRFHLETCRTNLPHSGNLCGHFLACFQLFLVSRMEERM